MWNISEKPIDSPYLPLASLLVRVSFVPKTGSGRSGALGHLSQLYLVHRQSQLVARRPKVPPATSHTFPLFSLNNIHFKLTFFLSLRDVAHRPLESPLNLALTVKLLCVQCIYKWHEIGHRVIGR